MWTKTLSSLFLLIALGCAPPPKSGDGSQQASGGEFANGEPKVICKKERPTGSAIAREVCHPNTEALAQYELQNIDRNSARSNHTEPNAAKPRGSMNH